MRLQKFLAQAGIASRRHAEQYILDGLVEVNGKVVTQLGVQINPEKDYVRYEGKVIRYAKSPTLLYAFYKPKNCISSLSDPQGRTCIQDYLHLAKTKARLFPIGRLDYDAEGLLLLTNNGDLANHVMHPSYEVWKIYLVKIKGHITGKNLHKLRNGVIIDGRRKEAAKVRILNKLDNKMWLEVSIREGVYHHIKKMFLSIGHLVEKIKRYSVANLELLAMKPGEIRLLAEKEKQDFFDKIGFHEKK